MNKFPVITLTPLKDGLYELRGSVTYTFEGKSITVPDGYKYDGASVPELFWFAIGNPFNPRFMAAALPHDYCYTTHEHPKEWIDKLFQAVLIENGVHPLKSKLMYDAVRFFGNGHWDA